MALSWLSAVPGGVERKHDDPDFYQFTLDVIDTDPQCKLIYNNFDIYAGPLEYPELDIKTLYEGMHLEKGRTIKYVRYTING